METIQGLKRSRYCGEFRMEHVGEKVTVFGWCQRQRDLGQLIFIDLRDRSGIVQLAFDEDSGKDAFEKAFRVRSEFVLAAVGTVRERTSKNKEIPTGDVEIFVEELRVLGEAETPPFEIVEGVKANEELRLKYRYLDLRRPELQRNLLLRHKVAKATRDYFYDNGFIEIETPMLIKSTPEGARDFLVPSRLHKGEFYALPQSPQLYKQLSMVAGFDRYIQLARCFRDEELRADRQPEFVQIDMEMSFVDVEDVLTMAEGFVRHVFKEVLGEEIPLEICDISGCVKDCGFGVFANAVAGGGSVRAIVAKDAVKALSRKEIDKLTEAVKGIGGKGVAWVRMLPEGYAGSFLKFMKEEEMQAIYEKTGAEEGDVVLVIADAKTSHVLSQLGYLRTITAQKLGIVPQGMRNLLWITEMPFFEFDEDLGEWVAMHHPFTSPLDECLPYLETDKGRVRAKAYDLVMNGMELCSGSIRITDPELQGRIFALLGLSEEEAHEKFGFLLDAFRYGAPPHGGIGLGLDRLVMQMAGAGSMRDVVAYPKVQNMSELMTQAPAEVEPVQLDELGIILAEPTKE